MNVVIDTSVWSLALRRQKASQAAEALRPTASQLLPLGIIDQTRVLLAGLEGERHGGRRDEERGARLARAVEGELQEGAQVRLFH